MFSFSFISLFRRAKRKESTQRSLPLNYLFLFFQHLICRERNRRSFATYVLAVLIGLCTSGTSRAEEAVSVDTVVLGRVKQIETLLASFKNDSALHVSESLVAELRMSGRVDTPMGIRARLAHAIAFEQIGQGDSAIAMLLPILELSKSMGLWEVYTRAGLSLALIHEKLGNKEKSLRYLTISQKCIDKHRVDSVYPYFAVRMASWQRLFNNKEQAIYYAREALRTAPGFQLKLEEAIGHMLMSFLLPKQNPQALTHALSAIRLYRELEDFTGYSAMHLQASKIYFEKGDFKSALVSNDSAVFAVTRDPGDTGPEALLDEMLLLRAGIHKALGNQDSAWIYMEEGYKKRVGDMQKNIDAQIAEIDSRYQTEQKQNEIEVQRTALKNRNILLAVAALSLIILVGLLYTLYIHYRRQQSAKWMLARQKRLIQHQAQKLLDLDKIKTRFFANISHELRTPLTLVLGPVNKLREEESATLTEKQRLLLNMASQSGGELSNLVNQILDLGKIDVGKMTTNRELTPLASFFDTYFAHFESLAFHKKISYKVETGSLSGVNAHIDREKWRQIVYNLLSNAFKFSPAGGTVSVLLRFDNEKLSLSIRDSGTGIDAEELPYLFDRYFQSGKHKTAVGGTGIGLAICKEYIQLMGGDIGVSSEAGKGSCFSINMPLERSGDIPSEKLTQPIPVSLMPVDLTSQNEQGEDKPVILVVEDNVLLRQYIVIILEETYQVVTAENGKDALEKLRETPCDLILTDLMMPVMDGYQLLERLKSDQATRGIPVVMLTARAEKDDKLNALRVGVDDYLTKPFDDLELKARIENLLLNQYVRREFAKSIEEDNTDEAVTSAVSETDQLWLMSFERYINDYYPDKTLCIPDIAHEFSMSESTLLRQLKRLTGLSPLQYLQEVRLCQARMILDNGQYESLREVALKVGYQDARTFSRSFKARFGKSPSKLILSC